MCLCASVAVCAHTYVHQIWETWWLFLIPLLLRGFANVLTFRMPSCTFLLLVKAIAVRERLALFCFALLCTHSFTVYSKGARWR